MRMTLPDAQTRASPCLQPEWSAAIGHKPATFDIMASRNAVASIIYYSLIYFHLLFKHFNIIIIISVAALAGHRLRIPSKPIGSCSNIFNLN